MVKVGRPVHSKAIVVVVKTRGDVGQLELMIVVLNFCMCVRSSNFLVAEIRNNAHPVTLLLGSRNTRCNPTSYR